MAMTGGNRQELAHFLRSRRAQLTPDTVGIPSAGRRRTPGLRREEVSQLSGVSLTWYTWLEQGRDINASPQVLRAIARTLRLSRAESEHLTALAGHGLGASQAQPEALEAPDSLRRLLQALVPNPAYVISPRWDVVDWNGGYSALFAEIDVVPAEDRNLLWMVFTNRAVRELLVDWQTEARRLISQFRVEAGHLLDDAYYQSLVVRLLGASAEFREWWAEHDVAYFASRRRDFNHPVVGALSLDHHKMALADYPDLRIVVYTPTTDSSSGSALARLLEATG